MGDKIPLDLFLLNKYQDRTGNNTFLVLKEIQDLIDDTKVKSLLMLIAQRKLYDHGETISHDGMRKVFKPYNTTAIIVSSEQRTPKELEPYISFLDIEFPKDDEIEALISAHLKANGSETNFDKNDLPKLKHSLKGMTAFQIDRAIDMAMSTDGNLKASDQKMILEQKKQMVKKSGLVELIDTPERLDSIGGMDVLKKYLEDKSSIMKDITTAESFGVNVPKGVFIVGMPGCGKSLCAKAAASQFEAPLLKLDMGSMMGKYVGESEGNLRRAIQIAEAAAPCVLWIDEIEKAFSGVSGEGSEVVTRMFGYFLSWMQDKTSSVYVIATANNADNLPPELKRKGRFDEIFCVNLPNTDERKAIFDVHLNKKKIKANGKLDLPEDTNEMAKITDGFNGADIESVVNETVEKAFLKMMQPKKDTKDNTESEKDNKDGILKIEPQEFIEVAKKTMSISKSCKKQIDAMKKVFEESNFTDASTNNSNAKK